MSLKRGVMPVVAHRHDPWSRRRKTMIAVVTDLTDPFDLDVSIIEGGEEIDVLLMSTDNGCSSTCPDACTGSAVAQMC